MITRSIWPVRTIQMAPKKGSSPFCRVENPQLLDSNKRWYVLSSKVCGERPPKYFSRNKFPARFPNDVVRVKRSDLRTVQWWCPVHVWREGFFRRRNRGFVVWFDCDISPPYTRFAIFQEETFEMALISTFCLKNKPMARSPRGREFDPCCKGHSKSPFGDATVFVSCILTTCGWRYRLFLTNSAKKQRQKGRLLTFR